MKYLRRWLLPTSGEPIIQHLDAPNGYGESYFWYCISCKQEYASASLEAEDGFFRPWRGLGGLCEFCEPHRFLIRGDLPCSPMMRKEFPAEIIQYCLEVEIAFLGHPAHPYNEEQAIGT